MRWVELVVVAVLCGGCLPYSTVDDPEPPVPVPERYSAGGEEAPAGQAAVDVRWWTGLGDPTLDALIERALRNSHDLRAARARIRLAEALGTQARAQRWPTVSAQGVASRSRNLSSFGSSNNTTLSASLPVSYEIDLFDRAGAETRAAELDAMASEEDARAVAITVSAQVAESYFDLVAARTRRTLLQQQLHTDETFLELTELRFRQGLSSAVDVHQQRQQVTGTQAELAGVDAIEGLLVQQISVLVGEPLTALPMLADTPEDLPELPGTPSAGVPAELLQNRPDIRAAQRRIEAADRRVGAAIASRFPSLLLTGSVGYTFTRSDGHIPQQVDTDMDGMPDTTVNVPYTRDTSGFVYNAALTLSVPLFDGGLRRGQTEAGRARVDEAVAVYGRTVQAAIADVQTALAQEAAQRVRIGHLAERQTIAQQTLDATRERYRQGLTDFLPVLTALASEHQSELALLDARRQLLSQRIQLYRALGGTWTDDLPEPERSDR